MQPSRVLPKEIRERVKEISKRYTLEYCEELLLADKVGLGRVFGIATGNPPVEYRARGVKVKGAGA
jgi:hypothetical protein